MAVVLPFLFCLLLLLHNSSNTCYGTGKNNDDTSRARSTGNSIVALEVFPRRYPVAGIPRRFLAAGILPHYPAAVGYHRVPNQCSSAVSLAPQPHLQIE